MVAFSRKAFNKKTIAIEYRIVEPRVQLNGNAASIFRGSKENPHSSKLIQKKNKLPSKTGKSLVGSFFAVLLF